MHKDRQLFATLGLKGKAPHTAPLKPDPSQSTWPEHVPSVRIDKVVQRPREYATV